MYPVATVEAGQAGFFNFIPSRPARLGGRRRRRRRRWRHPRATCGLVLFAFVLLPALNVNAFVPEQVVHDRYLYLPLLGALGKSSPRWHEALGRIATVGRSRAPWIVLTAAAVSVFRSSAKPWRYNDAWKTDIDPVEVGGPDRPDLGVEPGAAGTLRGKRDRGDR